MRIGKSQIRVSSSRSSEMRLHLNRVGTRPIVAVITIARQMLFPSSPLLFIDAGQRTAYALCPPSEIATGPKMSNSSVQKPVPKKEWLLTAPAFRRLLSWLHEDPNSEG